MSTRTLLFPIAMMVLFACSSNGSATLDLGLPGDTPAHSLSDDQWNEVCNAVEDSVRSLASASDLCSVWAGENASVLEQCDALLQACSDLPDLMTAVYPFGFCGLVEPAGAAAECHADVDAIQKCGQAQLARLDSALSSHCPFEPAASPPAACQAVLESCPEFDVRVLALTSALKRPERIAVLSAHPAAGISGEDASTLWSNSCGQEPAPASGFVLNVSLSDPHAASPGLVPGDWLLVDELRQLAPDGLPADAFALQLECLSQLSGDGECVSQADQTTTVQAVDFVGAGSGPEEIAVAILIDMSGSTNGLVDPFAPYRFKEDKSANVAVKLPQGLEVDAQASDPDGRRIEAAWDFISRLSPGDRYIVMTFGEDCVDVICDLAEKDADFDQKKSDCLANAAAAPLGGGEDAGSSLMAVKKGGGGRTPLWFAVAQAWDLMQNHSAATSAGFRHIVVLTDGPDTCSSSEQLNECLSVCLKYNTSFATFRATVMAESSKQPIPIHFLQIPAPGYPDPDPLQQEMACLTAGHYRFVALDDLSATLEELTGALKGYWRIAIAAPDLMAGASAPRGYLYGLEGSLTTTAKAASVLGDSELNASLAPTPLKIRCSSSAADCPETGPSGECADAVWWCSPQTQTCLSRQQWLLDGSLAECQNTTAVVSVEIKPETGPSTWEEHVLADLPTLCCEGACSPPAPPKVPADVRFPASGICFVFKQEHWIPETSADGSVTWLIEAQLRPSLDCTWEKVALYLELEPDPGQFQKQWDCSGKGNCYSPK